MLTQCVSRHMYLHRDGKLRGGRRDNQQSSLPPLLMEQNGRYFMFDLINTIDSGVRAHSDFVGRDTFPEC